MIQIDSNELAFNWKTIGDPSFFRTVVVNLEGFACGFGGTVGDFGFAFVDCWV